MTNDSVRATLPYMKYRVLQFVRMLLRRALSDGGDNNDGNDVRVVRLLVCLIVEEAREGKGEKEGERRGIERQH